MTDIAVVVLAAGKSRRMAGDVPKQLRDWHGEPLVRRAARVALESQLGPVVVVAGHRGDEVAAAVEDLDVRVEVNESWAEGQGHSVATGVRALPEDAGAALFLPCDQPGIEARHLRRIAEPWRHAGPESRPTAVVPLYGGERGAPVLFDRRVFPRLEALTGDEGGRVLLGELGDEVREVEMVEPDVGRDIDTVEEYEDLLQSLPSDNLPRFPGRRAKIPSRGKGASAMVIEDRK